MQLHASAPNSDALRRSSASGALPHVHLTPRAPRVLGAQGGTAGRRHGLGLLSRRQHHTAPPLAAALPSAGASADRQQPPAVIQSSRRARTLLARLHCAATSVDKVAVLLCNDLVQAYLHDASNAYVAAAVLDMAADEQYALLCLLALGQQHALQTTVSGEPSDVPAALARLAAALLRVDRFYDSVGGIAGYHATSLDLIVNGSEALKAAAAASSGAAGLAAAAAAAVREVGHPSELTYHVPRGLDLAGEEGRQLGGLAAACGLAAMPFMAEVYPVGGAGDRLGLRDDATGECLPAAMLPYCGRTMIHGLLRDLQAREYLHYKLTGRQVTTPVAIMTSDAKGNHARITQLMDASNWFGRGKEAFRLFRQPMVPVLSVEDGRWLLSEQLEVMMKPGGHGAIWKLMLDEGVFGWLNQRGCQAALVRQVSNPLAGTDTTLLALAGAGHSSGAAFGFMACERAVGAAEGMNVLQERKTWQRDGRGGGRWQYDYNVTNIEYTEFERLGIVDEPAECGTGTTSVFPANTNVLYVGLREVEAVVRKAVSSGSSEELLPGLIFNTKKKVAYTCPVTRQQTSLAAGRLESTMQNMADSLADRYDRPMPHDAVAQQLSTFAVSNLRRKVTSSAKKRREPGSTKIHQTPDGSFFDLQRNAWHLLQLCGLSHVPEVGSVEQYLQKGPGFIFLYHPALGPLWDVIAQKIRGGAVMDGSEVVLEVAEACLQDVVVDGSLLVHADNIMGGLTRDTLAGHGGGTWRDAAAGHGPDDVSGLTIHGMQFGEDGLQVPTRSIGSATRNLDGHLNGDATAHGGQRFFASHGAGGLGEAGSGGDGEDGDDASRLQYSHHVGRIHLVNVVVENAGVDWTAPSNLYWKHQVRRRESMRVVLHGQSEFEAHDVHITGDVLFEVPDGHKMVVTAGPGGRGVERRLVPLPSHRRPTWDWACRFGADGGVQLLFQGQMPARRMLVDNHEYVI